MRNETTKRNPRRLAGNLIGITYSLCLLLQTPAPSAAIVVNGSFETGDLSGWLVTDLDIPLEPIGVRPRGSSTAFGDFVDQGAPGADVSPTDGEFALSHGFDGSGPGSITLSQDIGVVTAGDLLSFDYALSWDLLSFSAPGPVANRTFSVRISRTETGVTAIDERVHEVRGNTRSGVGLNGGVLTSHTLDLSSLAGDPVTLTFDWQVPEFFTGPANAQLDDVRISNAAGAAVPEPASVCLLGLGVSLIALGSRRQAFRAVPRRNTGPL
jgi:hypothetical protein